MLWQSLKYFHLTLVYPAQEPGGTKPYLIFPVTTIEIPDYDWARIRTIDGASYRFRPSQISFHMATPAELNISTQEHYYSSDLIVYSLPERMWVRCEDALV